MNAEEFLGNAFGKDSETEKTEHFEHSTVKLLLRRIGWEKAEVDKESAELGPAFGFEWFNEQGLSNFPIYASRCFHFNIQDLLAKPHKCELLQSFFDHYRLERLESDIQDYAVVYKAFNLGRIVMSCLPTVWATQYRPAAPCLLIPMLNDRGTACLQTWDVFCKQHFGQEEVSDE